MKEIQHARHWRYGIRDMRFVMIVEYVLLLAGPVIGYRAALRQPMPTRLGVLVWSAAGGATAAAFLIVFMFLNDMLWYPSARDALVMLLQFIGGYAGFGLVVAAVGLVTGTERSRFVLIYAALIAGIMVAIREAV